MEELTVHITPEEHAALESNAASDLRDSDGQLRYILRSHLQRQGLLGGIPDAMKLPKLLAKEVAAQVVMALQGAR